MAVRAAGTVASLAAGKLVRSFLYLIAPEDPVIALSPPAILLAAALFAACLPARRAAGVDAMSARPHE